MPRFSIIATLVAVALLHFFTCSLCSFDEKYPYYYFSQVYKNEILVVNGDTVDLEKIDRIDERLTLSATRFDLSHINLRVIIDDTLPSINTAIVWTDSASSVWWFRYMSIKIEKFSIAIARIPYNAAPSTDVPAVKHELVDSIAYHIECAWEDNNSYSVDLHALKYLYYSTN